MVHLVSLPLVSDATSLRMFLVWDDAVNAKPESQQMKEWGHCAQDAVPHQREAVAPEQGLSARILSDRHLTQPRDQAWLTIFHWTKGV